MNILHVSDLHLNENWYRWLIDDAPHHDLLCISGDLLALNSPTPSDKQIKRVGEWLGQIRGPVIICSGNHDLEWDSMLGDWQPANWLMELAKPDLTVDGETLVIGGTSFYSVPGHGRPAGAAADVWLAHVPPAGTAVARTVQGKDMGDFQIWEAIYRYSPSIVLTGHVHTPEAWYTTEGSTMFFNAGAGAPGCRFPNHILVDTAAGVARRLCDGPFGASCEVVDFGRQGRRGEQTSAYN